MNKIGDLFPHFFPGAHLSEEAIFRIFNHCDASWVHDGDAKKQHALLHSGKHSNGFFNCLEVLNRIDFCEVLAAQLASRIRKVIGVTKIDWVVGSPMAGITFAYAVGKALGAERFCFVEKDLKDDKKKICRQHIPEGETVLQIEELVTTADTMREVKEAVELTSGQVNWLPVVGILIHRPPKLPIAEYDGRRPISLIEKEIWAIDPDKCPLCAAGSEAIKPKTPPENWGILTGKTKK